MLLLDAGNLFIEMSKNSKKECGEKELLRADVILESYKTMGYDAVNISQIDLVLGVPFLQDKIKSTELPFISANLFGKENKRNLFAPYIIKKINDLTIGIIGIMDQPEQTREAKMFTVRDPFASAREMTTLLKDKAGMIIVLSSLPREKNVKLLEDVPGIDFIISTDPRRNSPAKIGNAFMLSAGTRGKYMGRLDIKLHSLVKPMNLEDNGRVKNLQLSLAGLNKQISQLNNKKEDIAQSNNELIKKRMAATLEGLQTRQEQLRQELAKHEDQKAGQTHKRNSFDNTFIALAAKQVRKDAVSAAKGAKKTVTAAGSKGPGSLIKVSTLGDDSSNSITVVLSIDKAANPVRALGFDMAYDPKVVEYKGFHRGGLTNKFDMFDAVKREDGLLRIGGFEAMNDFIQLGIGGDLITLDFQQISKGDFGFRLTGLKDDIASWIVNETQPTVPANGKENNL